jgi:hypothetical protein
LGVRVLGVRVEGLGVREGLSGSRALGSYGGGRALLALGLSRALCLFFGLGFRFRV